MEIVGPKPAPISVCVPESAGVLDLPPCTGSSVAGVAGTDIGGPTPASDPGGAARGTPPGAGVGGFGCGTSAPLEDEVGGPSPSCACTRTIGTATARHAAEIRIGKKRRIFGRSESVRHFAWRRRPGPK